MEDNHQKKMKKGRRPQKINKKMEDYLKKKWKKMEDNLKKNIKKWKTTSKNE